MLQLYLKCNAEISVSKQEPNQMALISLWFRESPEMLSPLMSRTKADMFPFHKENKQCKILTEQYFREMVVWFSSAGFDAF